jgi:SAM-dependent methyltransferase
MESKAVGTRREAFEREWPGGYYEGDPLDPMGHSNYNHLGYMSVLHATYLACIKPYVNTDSRVLEVGAGRGAWTKAILQLNPAEVWCLEAASADTTRFWDYVGRRQNVSYNQVSDFSCGTVPDNYFNYFFTFGCFCHLPNEAVEQYMRSIHKKLKSGAHGFMMVGDFDKYNRALANIRHLEAERACHGRRLAPVKWLWKFIASLSTPDNLQPKEKLQPVIPAGTITWHHLSTQDACTMLEGLGYRIIDADVGINHRDPVIHFIRP